MNAGNNPVIIAHPILKNGPYMIEIGGNNKLKVAAKRFQSEATPYVVCRFRMPIRFVVLVESILMQNPPITFTENHFPTIRQQVTNLWAHEKLA